MIQVYKNVINVLLFGLFSWLVSSCNDLSVFMPPSTQSSLGPVSSITINEEGKLSLEWTKMVGRPKGTYEAYLIELEPSDVSYSFTGAMLTTAPLKTEELSLPYEQSPYQKGKLVASETELKAVISDILKPDRKYLLQLVEKRKVPKKESKVFLLQIDFETDLPTSAALADDGSIKIAWSSVAGANRYEVYADAELTILVGKSNDNSLTVPISQGKFFQEFYVRPMRGDLGSKDLLHVALDQSSVRAERVSSSNADGHYTTGDIIEFTVDFTDVVTVFGDTSLPILTEEGTRTAVYVSGGGSKSLLFRYTVKAGDNSAKLKTAAVLGGSYSDKSGLSVPGALPLQGTGTSLEELNAIAIDTKAPTAPFSLGFDTILVASGNFDLSWGAGTDRYFLDHSVKLCSDSNCSSACSTAVSATGSSKSFTGVAEGVYYGCVQANDSTGLHSAWASTLTPVSVDSTGPVVSRVFSSSGNGIYKEGQTVNLNVMFNEIVQAMGTGDLKLTLDTGVIDRDAIYVSGSGTNTLVFAYTIMSGDVSSHLNYSDVTALSLGGTGIIRDSLGNLATTTLPATNATNSLSGQSAIVIDTAAPSSASSILFVNPLASTTNVSFNWVHSSDPNFKQHNIKLCTVNDCVTGCLAPIVSTASPASLTGVDGSIYFACIQGEDMVGHMSAWAASSSSVQIDATAPAVTRVSATTANGFYKTGDTINVTVKFSEAVTVAPGSNIRLKLETGTTDRDAIYGSGSGTDLLTFAYLLQAGDNTNDLNYLSTTALSIVSGSIKDSAGHDATLTLPALNDAQSLATLKALVVDTSAPLAPSAVLFASALNNSTALSVSWGLSTDDHFDHHNLQLCSDDDCSVSCTSPLTSLGSPAVLTGVNNATYYACVQGEDVLGQKSAWVASALTASIDMTAPTVIDVTSSKANGLYTKDEVIDIRVKFSKAVNVTTSGDFMLALNTTPSRQATYLSGDASDTLVFQYTVSAGDTAADLGYASSTALVLGSGTIRDAAGNNANVNLPILTAANSLVIQKALVIDTTAPTSPASVGFVSTLVNSTTFDISWVPSTDAHFATHNIMLCAASDCTSSCSAVVTSATSPLAVTGTNGATYYGCVQGQDSLGLKSPWVSSVQAVTVDSSFPTVTNVSSTSADGAFKLGAVIPVTVTFSKAVYLTNPTDIGILLETGATDRRVIYASGDGTNTLTFNYTVQAGDTSADLNYESVNALTLGAGGLIKDLAGSNANRSLPLLNAAQSLAFQKAIVIDTTAPAAPSILSPANASYNPSAISIVTGTAEAGSSVSLISGGTVIGTGVATGGNWSITLASPLSDGSYSLTAKATDAALNESVASSANAFTVDTSGPSVPVIDALVSPSINQTPAVTGSSEAAVTISFYSNATLLGTSSSGASTSWAYNPSSLADGNYSFTATATDAAGRVSAASAAVLYSVDTINPTLPLSAAFAGTLTNSTSIPLTWTNSTDAHFKQHNAKLCTNNLCTIGCISETVEPVSPASLLGVNTGVYYGCVQGEDDLGHKSAWAVTPATIQVDSTEATVSAVTSSTADGYYTTNATIAISVVFSKPVNVVNGNLLRLKLETGATDHDATYVSGTGTDTLLFTYTVLALDASSDLNYFSTTALSLNGATIKDLANNNANLALPPLASTSALAGARAIRLDTTAPTAASSVGFTGTTVNSLSFPMTWAAGTDTNLDHYNTKICTDTACSANCTSISTSVVTNKSMTGLAGSVYYGCVQTVDAVGLTSTWTNSVGTMTIDTTAPTVLSVTSSLADGSYKAGQIVPIQVTFSENVVVVVDGSNPVKLKLETGATDRDVIYASGTGSSVLTFNYTVQATDTSTDLNYFDINSLTLVGTASIKDNAGSNAVLTLPALANAASLGGSKALVIDTTAPVGPSIVTPANSAYSMVNVTVVSGTSETGASIVLKNGSTTIGSTTATGINWSITLSAPGLADGIHTLTATAADLAGNVSTASSTNTLTVDTSAPTAPTVNAMTTPSTNATPTVSGTSEANMAIRIFANGTQVGTATANASGNWTTTASTLTDGAYSITATATDPGARVSAASTGVSYSVDTTNPTVPSAITFGTAYSQSTSLTFTWTAGTDSNFSGHKAKLCTANDCTTSCTADIVPVGNTATITGINGTTYFACVQSTDSLAHVSAWVPSIGSSKVDQTAPLVTGVSSAKANGWYTTGTFIDIDVTFNEAVNVGNTANLGLTLATTPTNRVATYQGGHGTSTLTFRYTVVAGDTAADLDYVNTTSLTRVSTGTIKDLAGNDATLTLPAPAATGSLGINKALVVDTTSPTAPVSPNFAVTSTNQTTFTMNWSAATEANFLQYNLKICPTTDCTATCVDPQTTTGLSRSFTGSVGATYYGCAQAQDKASNFSTWAITAQTITVDQTAPTITNISSTKADGSYTTGVLIPISVTFSKNVDVSSSGQIVLLMETGTTDRNATYSTGSGTNTLIFNYTVAAGDTAADLGPISLSIGTDTIRDTAGNNATFTIPADVATNSMRYQKAIVVDTTPPAAPVISTPANNAYVTTTLSTVTGTAEAGSTVTLYNGASNLGTAVTNGSGNWSMTLGTPLAAGSYSLTATAKDVATNTSGSSATNAITIDTTAPTTITLNSFTTPTNVNTQAFTGTAEAGMGVKVYQGSTEIASTTANGSGVWSVSPSALTDGNYTIKAQAFDPGGRTSSFTATRLLTVDTVAPTVLSVTSTLADGTYGIGQVVPVSVVFSESVAVGTPQLLMRTGASNTNANVVTGAASSTRIFNYTVASGNSSSDLDYVATNSLVGTVEDSAGNAAVLTLPAPGATNSLGANKAIVIDAVVATVTSVTSNKANGVYGPGNSMQIQMTFSRAVTVTGTPLLALNTTPAKNASYSGGSGSTVLTFDYTVASPDKSLDLDYASTSALTAGTIKDSVGNDANRTLPTTGSANSIGGSKVIEIAGDSNIPVLSASASTTNAYVGTALSVNVNNSTGNDSTNDSRALSYTCFYDNTVNAAMDSGGTACSSLAGATFSTSTGVLSWTPTSAQQGAYDTAKNYEFFVTGSSPANVSGTVYFTAKVIRPWTTAIGYDAGTASSYTFDNTLIDHTGGTVKLIAKDQYDGQYESDWAAGMGGTERKLAPYWLLKLGLNSFCGGHALNCFGTGDATWVPKKSNRLKFIDFGGAATSQFPGMTQPSNNMPVETTSAQKTGWTSYYFDGDDYAYHNRNISDDFTINIWMLTTSTVSTGDCSAFHHGAGIVSGEVASLTNDFAMALCDGYIIVGTGNSATGTEKSIRSKYRHNDNVWHMLTFTRVKSTGVFKLYVDGVLQASDSNGSNSLNAPTSLVYGRHAPAATYFVGNLDEGTIWDAALSDAEVSLVFDRQNPRGSGVLESRIMDAGYDAAPWTSITIATNQANGKELPDAGLSEATTAYATMSAGLMTGNKGLWHFNETSGNYIDRSGFGAHANTASSTSGVSGKFGRALSLNGSGQHVNLGAGSSTSFGTGSFSSSIWFRTPKSLGSGTASRIFSNGFYGINTGWFLRVYENNVNFGIGCTGSAANCINVRGSKAIADNQWHNLVTVTDRTAGKVKVFVDGVQENLTILPGGTCGTISGKDLLIAGCTSSNADKTTGYSYFGTHDNSAEFFEGFLDEAALWSRALTDAEALHIYKRGATRVLAQVKSCANFGCTDDPTNTGWKGPDGTIQSFFSEINNNANPSTMSGAVSTSRLTITFADYGLNMAKRYFQYRLILETDDRSGLCNYGSAGETCSPEITESSVAPDHYPQAAPIVFNTPAPFYTFNSLTEAFGGQNCSEAMRYNFSINGTNWYYHNGTTWVASNNSVSQSNTIAFLNTKAADFANVVGRGSLYMKAYLQSSGVSQCELNTLTLGGNTSY